jgi:hypothetical protein
MISKIEAIPGGRRRVAADDAAESGSARRRTRGDADEDEMDVPEFIPRR